MQVTKCRLTNLMTLSFKKERWSRVQMPSVRGGLDPSTVDDD
ncbi:MAG: hypothetical protein E6943_09860 [Actinomyces sp.]|jgi:hypothetical protein|nr:hypothetical protein [Actinomyces sp.]MDU6662529.1 hypothetical protein [Actinomyces sp.]